jgi:hypothetical protein
MNVKSIIAGLSPLVLAGCIQSHRAPVVYSTTPVYSTVPSTTIYTTPPAAPPTTVYTTPSTTTVLPPTSSRPVVRVYSPAPARVVTVTVTGAHDADLNLAENIRSGLSSDTSLMDAARNVQMSIYDGRVTMTGTTSSESARQLLHSAIAAMPGVASLDDQVAVELR